MPYVATQAISLRCIEYSETSQVVMLVTPDMGQIHVLAKGSRRPKKDPRRGPWDALIRYDCVLSVRATGNLHLATEWTPVEVFSVLRRDLVRFWTAYYAAEVALTCTSETADDGGAYACLLELLRGLERGEPVARARFAFLSRILRHVGCLPLVDHCAHCGKGLSGRTRFSPAAGGALCEACGVQSHTAFSVSRGALAVLRMLVDTSRPPANLRISREQVAEIQRAFNEQIQYHLGRPFENREQNT